MSHLQRREKTIPRFRFPIEPQKALDLLTESFLIQVDMRHSEAQIDENTANCLIKVTEALTAEKPKFGLWLYGDAGNGKTAMMRSIMRVIGWLDRYSLFKFMGDYWKAECRFIHAKKILAMAVDQKRKRDYNDLMDEYILCIDDLGTEGSEYVEFGNVKTPMIDLLSERYARQAFTIVTTNIPPNLIEEVYDKRVADRCREMFVPIKFLAPTYRK